MSPLDWTIWACLFVAAFIGYTRGLLSQLISLAGLFLAYIIAYRYYGAVSPLLGKVVPLHAFTAYDKYAFAVSALHLDKFILDALSFALLFIMVKLVLSTAGRVLNLVAKVPGINGLNRWSGLLLALVECAVVVVIAVNVMTVLPSDRVQKLLDDSWTARFALQKLPSFAGKLQQTRNPEPAHPAVSASGEAHGSAGGNAVSCKDSLELPGGINAENFPINETDFRICDLIAPKWVYESI